VRHPLLERNRKETIMTVTQRSNDEQTTLWNGDAGLAWVEAQESLDRMFAPIEELLLTEVLAKSARRVLDIGCGTGATTLAVARRLGTNGRCVGVDISEPMLELARARAEREHIPASFVRADAQTHGFEPASFDLMISRFGVMFFDDFVGAFTNLRRAAKAGGELRLVAWRSAAENPFMTTAERATAPLLPNLPPRVPDAPGQFAFADRKRVQRILEDSGWAEIELRPIEVSCAFPEKDLVRYVTRLGPVARVLQDMDEQARSRVVATARRAFEPYVHGDEVRFAAACWMVCARSPAP
jgi:ubiquinone/menaquinone biosynthesis C-methylase UbiE